jgi:LysR family nod box-dependent transcriptional activator
MMDSRHMDLRQFDLNLLVALDALLTESNVSRAAGRMKLSQSAMSGTLSRLRTFFNDELLVPVGRQMVLTPLAQELVQPVRDVLLQIQGTVGTKPHFDPASSQRHFVLAASDYVSVVLIADLLRQLRCEAPGVTFELRPLGMRAIRDLENGALDYLISPSDYVSPAHPSATLFEDTYTCIAWSENAHVGSVISRDAYQTLGHVGVHVVDGGGENYDERLLRRLNCKRNIEVVVPGFDLAPYMIVGTERIATVFTRLAVRFREFLPIKLVPLPVEVPRVVETLQWHRAHDRDPGHRWLRDQLNQAVGRLDVADAITARQPRRKLAR